MNTGIQDAYNLGGKLGSVIDGAERIPVARTVLALSSDTMSRAMEQVARGSEDGLSSALAGIADGSTTTGLGIRYRTGPLTCRDSQDSAPGPKAGDRAPNVGGLERPGFTGDLFDLLRGPHWSLLAYERTEPVALDGAAPVPMHVHRIGSAAGSGIVDAKDEFRRVFRPRPGELVLTRPDGYVAARLRVGQEAGVIDHLARFRPGGQPDRTGVGDPPEIRPHE
ncbi:hypothetical protein ACQEU8_10270 [Streptomyces sp. CA-250714]|uniref:hypothetical protein n=1 Tax=Streptomyces sp. CA-250714 TaxID=3240060 RepID=UPI003D8D1807